MEKRRFQDQELSVLMLGTVQFGLPYGIANRSGQPSPAEVKRIIAAAVEGGVNALDTAAVYGTSEQVLGTAIAELGLRDILFVATKVVQMADQGVTSKEADAIVEHSVTRSLASLKLDVLPLVLFHLETNWLRYADSLLRLKEKGLVRHVGSSVNFPGPAREIIAAGKAEAVQMPTSILDHRFLRQGIPALAASGGTTLFARSIYLQGLLLMPEKDVMAEHAAVVPVRRALEALAREAGMGTPELAVRYMLSVGGITCLVVGVDSEAQMRENTSLFSRGPLAADLRDRIERAVPDLPDSILYPGTWSKKMPAPRLVSESSPGGTQDE
jgi:aryl-alcohol dehydrogenase-like predicted oxidoreductase